MFFKKVVGKDFAKFTRKDCGTGMFPYILHNIFPI